LSSRALALSIIRKAKTKTEGVGKNFIIAVMNSLRVVQVLVLKTGIYYREQGQAAEYLDIRRVPGKLGK
jgi:hypothetical protein